MDEFAIDLDKVLDEFEKSEGGNAAEADRYRSGQTPAELLNTDVDEPRLAPNFPAFEGLDLDLAEADFAPSRWNYEISSRENDINDFSVAVSAADKDVEAVHMPSVELLQNSSDLDDESTGAPQAGNQIVPAEVDVLSACLHTCVEPNADGAGMHEQLENETDEEVMISPPDIVCSAPDVVSSAMVGLDVVPSSRTDNEAVAKLNLNQDGKDVMPQSAVPTLASLDIILQKQSTELELHASADLPEEGKCESSDLFSDKNLAQGTKSMSLKSNRAKETPDSPVDASEVLNFCEDGHKSLAISLDGTTACAVSDSDAAAAECLDTENIHAEHSLAVDSSQSPTAPYPPKENEHCHNITENVSSVFSPSSSVKTCFKTSEISPEETASNSLTAVLHKEVNECASSESSEGLDQNSRSAVDADSVQGLLMANYLGGSRFEAEPENAEICKEEMVVTGLVESYNPEVRADQSVNIETQARLGDDTECQNSDSNESSKSGLENSEKATNNNVIFKCEDQLEVVDEQEAIEVISDFEVKQNISEKRTEIGSSRGPTNIETTENKDSGSVEESKSVEEMSSEDEKPTEMLREDAGKIATEETNETEVSLVDKNETESKNEEIRDVLDDVAQNLEVSSADLSKEMANEDTRDTLSCATNANDEPVVILQKENPVVGFGCIESENGMMEEEIEAYLKELDITLGKDVAEAKCPEPLQNPDADDNSSLKDEHLSSEYVKFPPMKDGDLETEENKPSSLVSVTAVLEKTSEFRADDTKAPSSGELNQMEMLSSQSESFMLVNGNSVEGDVGCDSSEVPVAFGYLGDEQVESLMKEVEEEVRQMILAGEATPERDNDQTNSCLLPLGAADIAPHSSHTDKNHRESFEDQDVFVVYGSEVIDDEVLTDISSSEVNRLDAAPTGPDLSSALQGEVPKSQTIGNTGLEESSCGSYAAFAEGVATSDRSLPLPVLEKPDHQEEAPSSGTSHSEKDRPSSAADALETRQPEGVSGARQKLTKAVKPESLSLAIGLQQPPASLAEAVAEGNQTAMPAVVSSDIQPRTSSGLPSGILSPSPVSTPTIPLCSNISLEITQLGKVAPFWLPDAEASKCMECEVPFSFTRRRHHCRACGKVFCHGCSSLRVTLQYLENRQDRVCSKCYQDLVRASFYERNQPAVSMRLNPNVSGSTISSPVQAQASSELQQQYMQQYQPPASVPTGVLRKQGSIKGEAKQVMFSDGIRPGGDLTELDGSSGVRPSTRRPRKADKSSTATSAAQVKNLPEAKRTSCLIPNSGLPPVVTVSTTKRELTLKDDIPAEEILQQIKNEQDSSPVTFAINRDVVVMVKIINLDCCVNRMCWCFSTKGLCNVGQDEVVIILECLPDEKTVPVDILRHLHVLYEMASHGNTVNNLDHTVLPSGSLGSHEIGGFLYIRQTFQCLQKIILPDPPYLFGLLLQKWEMSWARVFPLRLMFRLGAEFRYYPCPLISVRSRKPVYGEIGHTIMNLLADFHNYQYMIPRINGLVIHMEDKRTTVSIPRNRYNMLMKILSNSDDHVIALGASFSSAADSHLVCLQNEDGNYQTQAINIQNRPRRVTGACFIVFNGALKLTSGLRAKSSIVEDGLMVQITSDAMTELKQVLSEMRDYKILCGSVEIAQPDEMVTIEWNNEEKHINAGVKSPIDGLPMYGVDSIRIHSSADFAKDELSIRWTEVFVLRNGASQGVSSEAPSEVSHLAESLAQACCQALVGHLSRLAFEMLNKIALRVTIDAEQVGYEIGSRGVRLPDYCMNDLDEKLIGIIHGAASQARSGPIILELIFHILHQYVAQTGHNPAPLEK